MAFLPENHALAIAIMSYNGQMNFGLLGDFDALPDIDAIGESIGAELATLVALAREPVAGDRPEPPRAVDATDARRAQPEDLEAVTETLWLAFGEDPLWRWAFPDHAQLRPLWRLYVGSALKHEWVWTIGDYAAATVWIPPGPTGADARGGGGAAGPDERARRAARGGAAGAVRALRRRAPARAAALLPDAARHASRAARATASGCACSRRTSS